MPSGYSRACVAIALHSNNNNCYNNATIRMTGMHSSFRFCLNNFCGPSERKTAMTPLSNF